MKVEKENNKDKWAQRVKLKQNLNFYKAAQA